MKRQIVTTENRIPSSIEILKKHFPDCFDKNGNFNLEKFKQKVAKEGMDFSKESYSLEWLGKSYARVLVNEPARTLLREDEEWNQRKENKNSRNVLIKGDNLEVLKHLINAYYEKIKIIYIDPPYNTGNDDFIYQDDRKFTKEELAELAGISEEKAQRILDFVNSKSNSHSAWLTFMYPRLYIARQLLREDGVIFVSIDDNEVAQLRILMDEIFGEENFVGQIIRQTRKGGGSDSKYLAVEHDYIVVYSKNYCFIDEWFEPFDENYLKRYKYEDEKGKYFWDTLQRKGLKNPLRYKITAPDGTVIEGEFVFSEKRFKDELNQGNIRFVKLNNGKWSVQFKQYLNKKGKKPRSLLTNQNYLNSKGKSEFLELFPGQKDIANSIRPKPVELIKWITYVAGKSKEFYILDFFAGSGTTGEAVMQLNAEDGGNRKFILVQLPESIDPKKNKVAYDFVKNELGAENPTIFDITKERLIRATKKITEDKQSELEELTTQIEKIKSKKRLTKRDKEKLDTLEERRQQVIVQLENIEKQDFGFKIFETIPIWEDYLKDEKELTEQTELFNSDKLTKEDLKALLITWKTYDGIPLTEDCREIDLGGYIGYYCGNNLYLMHKGWKTDNLKALLEKLDVDENFSPDRIIIFGYNFDSKHLKEIMDNVKNYANKKQIEIETILRF